MCPVCLAKEAEVEVEPCLHGYCADCLRRWFAVSLTCPVCRSRPERLVLQRVVLVSVDEWLHNDNLQRRAIYQGLVVRDDSPVPRHGKWKEERVRAFVQSELHVVLGPLAQVDALLVEIVYQLVHAHMHGDTEAVVTLHDYLDHHAPVFLDECEAFVRSGCTWEAYTRLVQYHSR